MLLCLLKYSSFLLISLCSIWRKSLFLFYNPCETFLLWEYTLCIEVDDPLFVSISYFENTCKIALTAFYPNDLLAYKLFPSLFPESKQCFIFIFLPKKFPWCLDTNYDSINVTEFNWHKVNQWSRTHLKFYHLCKILWDLIIPRKNISFQIYVNTVSTSDQKKSCIDYKQGWSVLSYNDTKLIMRIRFYFIFHFFENTKSQPYFPLLLKV